jgi:hypothetical protein
MVEDPRQFYMENCYALRGCLHCPDCIAFALKFYNYAKSSNKQQADDERMLSRALTIKFILSTIASENLPCEYALSSVNLRDYINLLMDNKAQLPHSHYEFR